MISTIFRSIIGLALGGLIISVGLSEAATRKNQYQAAIAIPGDTGEALSRLSSDLYAAGETKLARDMALRALEKSLFHVEALRVVGMTDYEQGAEKKGQRLVEINGELTWRDSPAQAWLLQRALIEGDYAAGIRHADSLLRRQRVREEIYGIFNLAGLDPKLSVPLAAQFENMPDWRENFFATRSKMPPDQYEGFENLVRALQNSDAPVTSTEMSPYINLLASQGQERRAIRLWSDLFPGDSIVVTPKASATLAWPQGERINKPLPFDWRFTKSRSVFASVEDPSDDQPAVLDLEMEKRALGEIAWRNLAIAPGTLDLTVDIDAYARGSLDQIRWSLECLTGGEKRYFGKGANAQNSWTINVSGDCGAYKLALEVRGGGITSTKRIRLGPVKLTVK